MPVSRAPDRPENESGNLEPNMVSKVARLDMLDYYRYTRLTYADIIYGYLWLEQYY
jgi:hypothetical protein